MIDIRQTGQPFTDSGVTGLCLMADKETPADLTMTDLEQAADRLLHIYTDIASLRGYFSVIFPNSHYVQHSKDLEERREYAESLLYLFRQDEMADDATAQRCAFFPYLKAQQTVFRQHIPLLNGENLSNFYGLGAAGLDVSGLALLAIHAMPFVCLRVSGRLLLFHYVDSSQERMAALNHAMLKPVYDASMQIISMLQISGDGSLPNYGAYRTRFVERVIDRRNAIKREKRALEDKAFKVNHGHITGYYFTNYGPGAEMQIVRMQGAVYDFVKTVQQRYRGAWQTVENHYWSKPKKNQEERDYLQTRFNRLLDNLVNLPERNRAVVRQLGPNPDKEGVGDWRLVEVFLRKVMNMQQQKIERIRTMGQKLAHYMARFDRTKNGLSWSFYHRLKGTKPQEFRALLNYSRERVSRCPREEHASMMVTADEQIKLLHQPGQSGYHFYLVRDLLAMVLFDELHGMGFDMEGNVPTDNFETDVEDPEDLEDAYDIDIEEEE